MATNKDKIKTLEEKQNAARAARRAVIQTMVQEIESTPLRQPSLKWAILLQRALAEPQQ